MSKDKHVSSKEKETKKDLEKKVNEAEEKEVEAAKAEENTEAAPEETAKTKEAKAEDNAEAKAEDTAEEESAGNEKLKAKIDELNDKCLRQMAEFENFRKRTDKEKEAMFETGAKSVIEKILPVIDNFERGFDALTDEDKDSKFAEGMKMIYKQLMDELDKIQVKPIEAVGKEFDPNLHNAVMQTESDEYESGIVAQELQKGYTYRDQVVRHSMVAVVS
ncbi:MAG TPA: nucleotide exchange factor GrpE [Lachnospiraceae bacterium]|nr:nucleotide exchange factor GrpE [Lachnospiraceae bacterium]